MHWVIWVLLSKLQRILGRDYSQVAQRLGHALLRVAGLVAQLPHNLSHHDCETERQYGCMSGHAQETDCQRKMSSVTFTNLCMYFS